MDNQAIYLFYRVVEKENSVVSVVQRALSWASANGGATEVR
jgi:hypothetical protein